jgi:cyclopropane fatty-acyl-phospholipid synthase-like methyltransferase
LKEKKSVQPNWEVEFFRDVALDMWRRAMSPEQTQAEAAFLEKALDLRPGSQVLDVPCGNGRHSVALARNGCSVTGIDLSQEFIEEARTASAGLDARFELRDMRRVAFDGEFDAAFCFGNSLTYLNPEECRDFFRAIVRSLKSGGKFAVETGMAAESILPTLVKQRWFQLGDLYMLSENQYHPRESRLDIQYTFIRDGKAETRPIRSYVLTVSELCRMQIDAGLEPLQLLASVNGEPYQLGSPRLILISQKQ